MPGRRNLLRIAAARADVMTIVKTLATGWLIYPGFFRVLAPRTLYHNLTFFGCKKRRQEDPMTTRFFCGMKLRPIRTDFWREKIDRTFYRGDLTGCLLIIIYFLMSHTCVLMSCVDINTLLLAYVGDCNRHYSTNIHS